MEFRRPLRLARSLLLPELPREIAERKLLRGRLRFDGFHRFLCRGERLASLSCFHALAIFWAQDAGTAQVFFRVDMLGWLLLVFFTRALLAGCFGNILSLAIRNAEKSAGKKQKDEHEETVGTQQIPKIWRERPHRIRIFEVRHRHSHHLRGFLPPILSVTVGWSMRIAQMFLSVTPPRSAVATPHLWFGTTKESESFEDVGVEKAD
jgi:hypothetical protein